MPSRAVGRQVGISAKRVYPVLAEVRGMRVQDALDVLRFQPGPTAEHVAKILRSAVANAENNMSLDPSRLRVIGATADQGPRMRRFRARARGRVGRIARNTSHITITVDEEER